MIKLQCLQGPYAGQTLDFDKDSILLGRGADCDLPVVDVECSQHHARIQLEEGEYWLLDLDSTNGVLVNGEKIKLRSLTYGDSITLGRTVLVFLTEMEPYVQNTVTSKEAETYLRELSRPEMDAAGEHAITGQALQDLRKRTRQMNVLHRLSLAINKTLELDDLYTFIAGSILENFPDAERVSIYTKKEGGELDEVKLLCREEKEVLPASSSLLSRVERECIAILATDASVDERFAAQRSVALSNLRSLLCVPLIRHDKFFGAIYVENCTRPGCFGREDLELLTVAGNQAAVAMENASLYEKLQYSFIDTVRSLSNAIEAKDRYTRGHSARVAHYSVGIARGLGFPPERITLLKIAAELHDIGKIAVKEVIIGKAGKLTDAEFELMKRHPQLGVNILKPIRMIEPVLPFILHHHERLNGEGYPDGLSGDAIPLEARIINVADAFDAMTTKRPYNNPKSRAEAIEQCRKEAGVSFDADCVRALEEFVMKKRGNEKIQGSRRTRIPRADDFNPDPNSGDGSSHREETVQA